jgi:hypothetical protein
MVKTPVVSMIEARELGRGIECVVKVYEGSVNVGDTLALEGTASDPRSVRWEVIEIRYYQRLIFTVGNEFRWSIVDGPAQTCRTCPTIGDETGLGSDERRIRDSRPQLTAHQVSPWW